MNRLIHYVVITIILFSMLTGCLGSPSEESHSDIVSKVEESSTPFSIGHFVTNIWKPYKGTIPQMHLSDLPTIELIDNNHSYHILNNDYLPLNVPKEKWELSMTSGWRINLDNMVAVGKTENDNIILCSEGDEPLAICLLNNGSGSIQCLLRKDIAEAGIGELDCSFFNIYYKEQLVQKRASLEFIWLCYTQENIYPDIGHLLDGDFAYETFIFSHIECPALQYEINIGVYGDSVYMENLYCENMIRVPIADIPIEQ